MQEPIEIDNILTGEIEEVQETIVEIENSQVELTGEVSTEGAGEDGFSPLVTVTKEEGKTTLSITDRRGTTTSTILDGTDGKSAFQIAEDNGFIGTESEWLDSLKAKVDLSNYATKEDLQRVREENDLQII